MEDKKKLKEKIDEVARKNCNSWAGAEDEVDRCTTICCLVRDLKEMIDAM